MTSSPTKVVADTHALVWFIQQSSQLSPKADEILRGVERGEIELVVPTIVIAEAIHISERRNPAVSVDEILALIAGMPSALIVALDMPILEEVRRLPPRIHLHDRIIVATSRVYGASLLTRDRIIAGAVDTIW